MVTAQIKIEVRVVLPDSVPEKVFLEEYEMFKKWLEFGQPNLEECIDVESLDECLFCDCSDGENWEECPIHKDWVPFWYEIGQTVGDK